MGFSRQQEAELDLEVNMKQKQDSMFRVDVFLGVNLLSREGNSQTGDRMPKCVLFSYLSGVLSKFLYIKTLMMNP